MQRRERELEKEKRENETRLSHSQDVHQESLLSTVKRCKWVFFGHVTRHNILSKSVLQSTFGGSRHRGDHSKNWVTNVSDGLVILWPAHCRPKQKREGDRTAYRSADESQIQPQTQTVHRVQTSKTSFGSRDITLSIVCMNVTGGLPTPQYEHM